MSDLFSVEKALDRILAVFHPVSEESISVIDAVDRILAESVQTPFGLPIFTNSSMDGYAVVSRDTQGASPTNPIFLKISQDIPAGSLQMLEVRPGEAARIMTGAPLPPGSDSVVPVEDTDGTHPVGDQVAIFQPAQPGQAVRPAGMDIQAGQLVYSPGKRLTPQDIGFLTSLGLHTIKAYRRPRVALFSSGDELATPGTPLKFGQIYNANSAMLAASLHKLGAVVVDLGVAQDTPQSIEAIFQKAEEANPDLILSSAGVSVGAYDYVRQAVEKQGELTFWKVNMRPGKPLAVGRINRIPFIGLPGNPVSAFVGFQVFVVPVIYKLGGSPGHQRRITTAELLDDVESDGRESYLRAEVIQTENNITVGLTGHQGSANLYALTRANALLILPAGVKSLPAGSRAKVWILD